MYAKGGVRSGDGERGIVVIAVRTDVVLLEFRNGVLAIGRLSLHRHHIGILPVHDAPGADTAGLHAGASVKNDQNILAQVAGLVFLAYAQAFARRHHQNDGDDSPGNSEHGQERAQLVGPERTQHIANQIAKNHMVMDAAAART